MTSDTSFKKIHFIGICGTAMGSVAAMLQEQGYEVTGSDERIYPPMSTFLQDQKIRLTEGFSPDNLKHNPDLVVVGNAISRGNPELEEALDRRFYYLSLPETLKLFFLRKTHNLVVTGTHGKTTTTSLLAWIFEACGKEPSYMIGGIPLNFAQGCKRQKGAHWVLEGDEYDTAYFDKRSKFLHYLPELVIINNVEFDHADIYANLDAIKLTFERLAAIVPRNGMILVNGDDENAVSVTKKAQSQIAEVGFSENCGIRITDMETSPAGVSFTILGQRFTVPIFGIHNARNAAMAAAAAHFYQIPLPQIAEALAKFKGIKRRLEVVDQIKGITLVDDFGHHPTALRETIGALRSKFPGRKLWALFEPRSNTTRRAVFQHDLPAALGLADGVLMTKVARADQLKPEERLDPEQVIADIAKKGIPAHYEENTDTLIKRLLPLLGPDDVVCAFSNGSFDGVLKKIATALRT